MDLQSLFLELTSLRGKSVKVSAGGIQGTLEGILGYVSFDSFLLETSEGNRVIPFAELFSLEENP